MTGSMRDWIVPPIVIPVLIAAGLAGYIIYRAFF